MPPTHFQFESFQTETAEQDLPNFNLVRAESFQRQQLLKKDSTNPFNLISASPAHTSKLQEEGESLADELTKVSMHNYNQTSETQKFYSSNLNKGESFGAPQVATPQSAGLKSESSVLKVDMNAQVS
jgi:hypothetical protein